MMSNGRTYWKPEKKKNVNNRRKLSFMGTIDYL